MGTATKDKVEAKVNSLEDVVNAEVLTKVDTIKEHLTIDKDNGVITVDSKAFEATLPEGTTLKDVQKTMSVLGDYTVAAQVAISQAGIEMMKENTKLEKVTSTVNMDNKIGHVTYVQQRHASGPIPGKEGERWNSYGAVQGVVDLKLLSTKRGTARKVRDYFCTVAEEELK